MPAWVAAVTLTLSAVAASKLSGLRCCTVIWDGFVRSKSLRSAAASATFCASVSRLGSVRVSMVIAERVSPSPRPAASVTVRPCTLAFLTTGLVLVMSLSRPGATEMPNSRSDQEPPCVRSA